MVYAMTASAAGQQRIITAVDLACKKIHARNDDQFPASDCFKGFFTASYSAETAHSFFNSLSPGWCRPADVLRQRPAGQTFDFLTHSNHINFKLNNFDQRPTSPTKSSKKRSRRRKHPHRTIRYQRSRCDERLRPWQVDAVHDADAMARRIGRPLNQFVTIKWKWTALGMAIDQAPFMAGNKAMAEWFERRDNPMTLVYVHENPDGQFNTHILIHVPKKDQENFVAKLIDWFGPITNPAAIDIRPRDWLHAKYLCKGTDWITARRVGWYPKPQGTIPFKRAGGTNNIWRKGPDRFQARQHSAE